MYRKLSSPFQAIALAALLIVGAGPAVAQISGTFVFTSTGNCVIVVPPASFDSLFRPTAAPVYSNTFNAMGYRVFNADGTGSQVILLGVNSTVPVPPGTGFTAASSSASSWSSQQQFTYTVSGGIITTTLKPNSYLQTYSSGPRAGQTSTVDVLGGYGYLSADGKSLAMVSQGTQVETHTFSNGDVRPMVCNRSAIGFRS